MSFPMLAVSTKTLYYNSSFQSLSMPNPGSCTEDPACGVEEWRREERDEGRPVLGRAVNSREDGRRRRVSVRARASSITGDGGQIGCPPGGYRRGRGRCRARVSGVSADEPGNVWDCPGDVVVVKRRESERWRQQASERCGHDIRDLKLPVPGVGMRRERTAVAILKQS